MWALMVTPARSPSVSAVGFLCLVVWGLVLESRCRVTPHSGCELLWVLLPSWVMLPMHSVPTSTCCDLPSEALGLCVCVQSMVGDFSQLGCWGDGKLEGCCRNLIRGGWSPQGAGLGLAPNKGPLPLLPRGGGGVGTGAWSSLDPWGCQHPHRCSLATWARISLMRTISFSCWAGSRSMAPCSRAM